MFTWSMAVRRPPWNSRCSSAAGVAANPSVTTLMSRTCTTIAAPESPIAPANVGASAIPPSARTTLEITDRVFTVGAIRAGSPGHRMMAKLTPISLMLRIARSATLATANSPNSDGPRSRASTMPMATEPNRPSAVLTKLQASAREAARPTGGATGSTSMERCPDPRHPAVRAGTKAATTRSAAGR